MVDASAVVEHLFDSSSQPYRDVIRSPDATLHVPELCDLETLAGLRRSLLQRALTAERATGALADYLDLPIERHRHQSLLHRVLELRANFSVYDATYVALAEQLGAELLTADARLMRAVRAHTRVGVIA